MPGRRGKPAGVGASFGRTTSPSRSSGGPPPRRSETDATAARSALGERVLLEPMTAVERKVVHLKLKEIDGVETTSEGTEPNRYVIVLPA